MGWLIRWIKRAIIAVMALVVILALPIVYIETACRGTPIEDSYVSLLPPEHHRPEGRTYLTYPEWHIVHAYDDYAQVIDTQDPHNYNTLQGITGFWTSLCALSETSASHGGFPWATKQMVYVIGVSFTAELALKAAYEETIGRLFVGLRGADHSPLDTISARQARDYATFLQQVPWYRWDFDADIAELKQNATDSLRDRERRIALGLEFRTKSAYAGVIEQAVASAGADALTLRMIVTGLSAQDLAALPDVRVITERPEGIEIETPRYRVLTHLLADMAQAGGDFVEIAGNDDIMLTLTSPAPDAEHAIFSFARQGYGDYRHLEALKITDLAERLRALAGSETRLEHIHDY